MLRIDDAGERIPLTFSDWSAEEGWIRFIFMRVGKTLKVALAAVELDGGGAAARAKLAAAKSQIPLVLMGYFNPLLAYGPERLAMYLQGKDSVFDLVWTTGAQARGSAPILYRDVYHQNEVEQSRYNFELADTKWLFGQFGDFEREAKRLLAAADTVVVAPPVRDDAGRDEADKEVSRAGRPSRKRSAQKKRKRKAK